MRKLQHFAEFEQPLLDEDNFDEAMKKEVEPYLAQRRLTGSISEQVPLYYELYPLPVNKGTVVICHGYTDSTEKYHEFIYYLLKSGYQVAIYDQRGHGKSIRETADKNLIHIRDFEQYVRDLHIFVYEIVMTHMQVIGTHLFLFAHSMGGCVATRYIETYVDDFSKVILNAPMLGLNLGRHPAWVAETICLKKIAAGKGETPIFNHYPFSPEPDFAHCSTNSEARYLYYHHRRLAEPAYQTNCASYYWGREAIRAGRKAASEKEVVKIKADVLMFIAGQETLVDLKAQKCFLKHMPRAKAIYVKESRHEIYRAKNEVLKQYMGNVIAWFGDK